MLAIILFGACFYEAWTYGKMKRFCLVVQQFFHCLGKCGGISVLDVLFHDLRCLLFFVESLITTFAMRNYMEIKGS